MASAVSRKGASVVQLVPVKDAQSFAVEGLHGDRDETWVRLGELRWGGIMIAGPLVPERAFDDHEVGRRRYGNNLAGRGEAEQKAASAGKQLLRNQDGERGADGVSDDADGFSRQLKGVKLGVIARPGCKTTCLPGSFEVSDDVAVGIKDANRRHIQVGEVLLATGFAQQRLRIKDRRLARALVVENGRRFHHPGR